jgi:hypothetical protein
MPETLEKLRYPILYTRCGLKAFGRTAGQKCFWIHLAQPELIKHNTTAPTLLKRLKLCAPVRLAVIAGSRPKDETAFSILVHTLLQNGLQLEIETSCFDPPVELKPQTLKIPWIHYTLIDLPSSKFVRNFKSFDFNLTHLQEYIRGWSEGRHTLEFRFEADSKKDFEEIWSIYQDKFGIPNNLIFIDPLDYGNRTSFFCKQYDYNLNPRI